jgi:hypothetical protein
MIQDLPLLRLKGSRMPLQKRLSIAVCFAVCFDTSILGLPFLHLVSFTFFHHEIEHPRIHPSYTELLMTKSRSNSTVWHALHWPTFDGEKLLTCKLSTSEQCTLTGSQILGSQVQISWKKLSIHRKYATLVQSVECADIYYDDEKSFCHKIVYDELTTNETLGAGKKKKCHVSSGVRTHAPLRRPELESGALDHSAMLTGPAVTPLELQALQMCNWCECRTLYRTNFDICFRVLTDYPINTMYSAFFTE